MLAQLGSLPLLAAAAAATAVAASAAVVVCLALLRVVGCLCFFLSLSFFAVCLIFSTFEFVAVAVVVFMV